MSVAACEIPNPPAAIRYAKIVLLLQLAAVALGIAASMGEATEAAQFFIMTHWLLYLVVCALIGIAASKMGSRWWRYALGAFIPPFLGPLMSLHILQRWRDTRP
jgi:hypothetical protein